MSFGSVAENHGGPKRLLRIRVAMRVSKLGLVLLRAYAALAAGSLILGAPVVASVFVAIGLVNLGVIGWQLARFGRLMHWIVEAVARQAGLMPAEPIARPVLPIGKPRTT